MQKDNRISSPFRMTEELQKKVDKLRLIDGEYDDWVSLKDIEQDAEIAARVETLYCDTRDFALGWNFKQVEPYKKASIGLEYRTNEGLKQIEKLKRNGKIADCLIEPHEILPWLNELCQKSGGYDKDWRFLTAKVEGCYDWDIKYVRFVRQSGGRFIACNSYFWPIEWRKVVENIYDPIHDADREEEQPERDKAAEYAKVVGRKFRPTFDSPIDHFTIRGYDKERDMVLTTAHPKEGSPFDDEIEERYLMGAFETGDYEPVYPDSWSKPQTYTIHNYDMPTPPKPLKQKFCGPCCNRCQHRFGNTSNACWCQDHWQQERCYRFKLQR